MFMGRCSSFEAWIAVSVTWHVRNANQESALTGVQNDHIFKCLISIQIVYSIKKNSMKTTFHSPCKSELPSAVRAVFLLTGLLSHMLTAAHIEWLQSSFASS